MPQGKGTYGNKVGRPPKKKYKNEVDMSNNYLEPKEYATLNTLKDMINPMKTGEVIKRAGKYYSNAVKGLIEKRKSKSKKESKSYNI